MKPFKRMAYRLGAVGAALALSMAGLLAVLAPPASGSTITETFSSFVALNSSWTQLQLPETINQPASVVQGSNITMTVPGGSQVVPTSQSSVPVNYISGLTIIVPIPANSTFVPGSIVGGSWSFTDSHSVTSTGTYNVTYCTGPVAGTCTASAPSANFLGPAVTDYLEATTGSAQFTSGGTLTLPDWSAQLNASGTGSITSTVAEFDTNANVNLAGTALNASLAAYPSVVVASPTSAPAYQYQPIATTTILSPPAAPVLQPQSGAVSAGACTTINALNGATDTGSGDSANPASVTVVSPPAHGTTSVNTATGAITYCNTGGTAATDSFTVTAADTLASPALVSAAVTETVAISYNTCVAGSGNAGGGSGGSLTGCSLSQEIVLPVTAGNIVLKQASGLPTDFLGSSFCGTPGLPGIVLNGNEQAACGAVSPLTITNATGLDTGWTLTGQVTDFNDPAAPALTCDTTATYNNHCIPGGNLSWLPDGAVAHSIVPGDTAQVTPGAIVPPFTPVAPAASTNPILQGSVVQSNPVVEPSPNAGLHSAPQTMCSTAAGQAGGTFICAAGLELLIPASVAEPAAGAFGPAYTATLTLTLS